MEAKFCCMKPFFLFLVAILSSSVTSLTHADTHFHQFVVEETAVSRLCRTKNIITVNGQFPGPTIAVRNGDSLVIQVTNKVLYDVTLHWHGVRQMRTPWADGPAYVTQCPIRPGETYTYRFKIDNQEGTLWWHAHSQWLRATVYGALVIFPKAGSVYPTFSAPKIDVPIILGEWWDRDINDVMRQAVFSGAAPNVSDAYTINGQPGDLYRCSSQETVRVQVSTGDKILLRVINAALNQQLFFSVANHRLTVVGVDGAYNQPFTTDVIMVGPGQTTNVLVTADQAPGRYYMAARAYASAPNAPFDNTTTTAVLEYRSATARQARPVSPQLPAFNDSSAVTRFTGRLKGLPKLAKVPSQVDEELFFTVGLGLVNCTPGPTCRGPNNTRFAASMNNVSFVLPRTTSLLQAYYDGVPGIFTTDFPANPTVKFDYTGNVSRALWQPGFGTKLYNLKYGSNVQIVLQDTAIFAVEDHPIHLHGYHFFVVGQGFGNFNPKKDTAGFNLVDPPVRNTVDVQVGGWVVIRFAADNPGVWLLHCHIDSHFTWGLAMAFIIENGEGESQSIEQPPDDLPQC